MSGSGPLDRAVSLMTAAAGLITSLTGLGHLLSRRSRSRARARLHRTVAKVVPPAADTEPTQFAAPLAPEAGLDSAD